jgi:hypothetical protein
MLPVTMVPELHEVWCRAKGREGRSEELIAVPGGRDRSGQVDVGTWGLTKFCNVVDLL